MFEHTGNKMLPKTKSSQTLQSHKALENTQSLVLVRNKNQHKI